MKALFKTYFLLLSVGLIAMPMMGQYLPSGLVEDESPCISFIPAAISPNGDGINDTFSVQCECLPEHFSIRIFDPANRVVFQSTDIRYAWDGTFHGVAQSEGIYTYELAYRNPQGEGLIRQQGEIALVR